MSIKIIPFTTKYTEDVIKLILSIQQDEFGVDITIEEQPDLLTIEEIYKINNGNFWVALDDEKLVGTIALLPLNKTQTAIRKLFVSKTCRGKGVSGELLRTLLDWSQKHQFREVYLGTTDKFIAAQKFYAKNGFITIKKSQLPTTFKAMDVDSVFYLYNIK